MTVVDEQFLHYIMLKIVTIVGARPQFIKAATISRCIRENYTSKINEILVHTGQHYDENMSQVFFKELDIPHPKYNLDISGGQHGAMTGRMLEAVERVLIEERPDFVLIYGDTNSTLAGALAAVKLHIPVAHIEAGLRSFNMRMPEEVNRILSDRIAALLFCPTETAVNNLRAESIVNGVYNVGDVMYDAAKYYCDRAIKRSKIIASLGLAGHSYVLATCHRAENTDESARLRAIVSALGEISSIMPVVLPLHPRTRKLVSTYGLKEELRSVKILDPLPFLDMVTLEQSAKLILTDSGGIQKEAFFYKVPCITMRDETEWVETVDLGWNTLVGASKSKILDAFFQKSVVNEDTMNPYGDGNAANKIVSQLVSSAGQ